MLVHRILPAFVVLVALTACTAIGSAGVSGSGTATSIPPKDTDAVWVAVIGDSILADDCYTCSAVVVPSLGGGEEIRPVLEVDPHIVLVDYDARYGATAADHGGYEAALRASPDELVVDLYPNDAAQIATGRTMLAQTEARIVTMVDEARDAGVDCLDWVTYQSAAAHLGAWELVPGWAADTRLLRDFIVGLAATRPELEVLDFGGEADDLMAHGTAMMDSRDWVHYRTSASSLLAQRIRERVLDGRCSDATPPPTTTTTQAATTSEAPTTTAPPGSPTPDG